MQHQNGQLVAQYHVNVQQRYVDSSAVASLQPKLDAYAKATAADRKQLRPEILSRCDTLQPANQAPLETNFILLAVASEKEGKIAADTIHLFNDIGIHGSVWKPVEEMMAQRTSNPNAEQAAEAPFDHALGICLGIAAEAR